MTDKSEKKSIDPEVLKKVRFLILDVDGVMTDGSIMYTSSGDEIKTFNVKDGAGIKYWTRAGYSAAIITGRTSSIVERRAAELDIQHVYMGVKAKLPAFERVLAEVGVRPDEVAMIGDDLMDLPIMRRAGLGVAVGDAVQELKDAAHFVTTNMGGKGAVREVVELILKSQGRWEGIMERYLV